ncbi:MAG: S-layer homology domain-containing protein, partial [Leptolyngbyaceae cyanobacterium bins.302]|nr:S-layer homology domain-containing protein [Leptolyngbyaceae cyanobacterium bins.302]
MFRVVWNSLWLSPMLVGAAVLSANAQVASQSASAEGSVLNQVSSYGAEGRSNQLDQVTSVSQFSDVRPTDWAFQALQSLVERYGCIVGYPDKTYRGNRALS